LLWTWGDGTDPHRWASDLTCLALSPNSYFPVTTYRSSTGLAITRGDSRQLRTSAGLAPVGFSFTVKFTTDIKLEIQDGEKNPGNQHPNKKTF